MQEHNKPNKNMTYLTPNITTPSWLLDSDKDIMKKVVLFTEHNIHKKLLSIFNLYYKYTLGYN